MRCCCQPQHLMPLRSMTEAVVRWWQGMYRKALEAKEGAVEAGHPAGNYERSLHRPCQGGAGIYLHSQKF